MNLNVRILLMAMLISCSDSNCNIPKECNIIGHSRRQLPTEEKEIKCLLTSGSQIRFNRSSYPNKSCITNAKELIIRPKAEGMLKLSKRMLDLKDLNKFVKAFDASFQLVFQFFKGFGLNLYDESEMTSPYESGVLNFHSCVFDFYLGDTKMNSCKDLIEATNSTNPRSILQLLTNIYKGDIRIQASETKSRICPLAFKDVNVSRLWVFGENTFFTRSVLSFQSDLFENLNSTITSVLININNVELDFDLLHPSVFKELVSVFIFGKVKKIHPDLFTILSDVSNIYLKLEYLRSFMHSNGIEWIKSMNKNIRCDLTNRSQILEYMGTNKIKLIHHDCGNNAISPPLIDVFPDEDFCLYKDFPIDQLVIIYKTPETLYEFLRSGNDFGCTYLWITRSYKDLVNVIPDYTELYIIMKALLNSNDYKSISRCNFEERLKLCNRSTFESKRILTFFELGETMELIRSVINISSYILSIFGLVTNVLIILTISSKKNQAEFKGCKQYDYLRLNSIFNCLILLIHLISWLNQCIYPFQVFCPLIRKAVFMQYFKIIVEDVFMTALRFMNNFTYVGFAFNRISLIGKDHNRLVRFMSELAIKKYICVSLSISVILSVIKFFQYDINYGKSFVSYPISYDYISSMNSTKPNLTFFILDFISDMLNHFVFLFVNLAIDIGMIVKLRKTLGEKLENSKSYNTQAQQEKKKVENEFVLNNATTMVILNSTLNLILKLPIASYSFIYLYYSIVRIGYVNSASYSFGFERFFKRYCIDASLCDMLFQLADFLYLLYISIQLFFYRRYDKKFSLTFKKSFGSENKSIQMGLFSYFNLVNIVSTPNPEIIKQ